MIRRRGQAPNPRIKHRLRPGAYVILPIGTHLLLTRQDGSEEPLQLPGGGIDPGEQPLRALHREVFEETGWRIARPVRFSAARRFVYMPEYGFWAEKLCLVYIARPVRRLAPPLEENHHVEFVPIAECADRLNNPVDKSMVRQALRRGLIS